MILNMYSIFYDWWFSASDLIFFNKDGTYKIKKKEISKFFHFLGKLNITYLTIDAFYQARAKIFEHHTLINKDFYSKALANKINKIFYTKKPISDMKVLKTYEKDFAKILQLFKKEVEKNNTKFHVVIFPSIENIEYFNKIIKSYKLDLDIIIPEKHIAEDWIDGKKNKKFYLDDGHWNEFGNLEFAKLLKPFLEKITLKKANYIDFEDKKTEIKNFYKKYK